MKKTSVTPKAIFEAGPSPNHTAKIGARITRGMEFKPLMKGSSTAAAVGARASHRPTKSPETVPITKAIRVS